MALLSLLWLQTRDGQEGGLSRADGPGRLGVGGGFFLPTCESGGKRWLLTL